MLWLQGVSCAVGCLCAVDRAVVLDRVNVSWFPHEQHVLLPRDRAQRRAQRLLALVCLRFVFCRCWPRCPVLVAVVVPSLLLFVWPGPVCVLLLTRCFCFVVDLFFRGPCTFELSVSFSFLVSCIHVAAAACKLCCRLFVCG